MPVKTIQFIYTVHNKILTVGSSRGTPVSWNSSLCEKTT